MKVKAWGTRGSIAISNPNSVQAGGNTTCYEVISDCIPHGHRLMIDAGTGFVPAGWHYLRELGNGLQYHLFFTHWHYDHILGLTLAPPTFIPNIPMTLYGPVDEGIGPKEMVQHIFKRPFFPVDARKIMHKMKFKNLEDFDVHVVIAHPKGGFATLRLDRYQSILDGKRQVSIGQRKYMIDECLVIKMAKTSHGNSNCISYRFEENPTGKVFVFCTDHEDVPSIPVDMRGHFQGADLLIMDAQYDQTRYMTQTGGYGHGTPFGCVKQGVVCGAKRMGFTHHDPSSVDEILEGKILPEGKDALKKIRTTDILDIYGIEEVLLTEQDMFLCFDYQEYEV